MDRLSIPIGLRKTKKGLFLEIKKVKLNTLKKSKKLKERVGL